MKAVFFKLLYVLSSALLFITTIQASPSEPTTVDLGKAYASLMIPELQALQKIVNPLEKYERLKALLTPGTQPNKQKLKSSLFLTLSIPSYEHRFVNKLFLSEFAKAWTALPSVIKATFESQAKEKLQIFRKLISSPSSNYPSTRELEDFEKNAYPYLPTESGGELFFLLGDYRFERGHVTEAYNLWRTATDYSSSKIRLSEQNQYRIVQAAPPLCFLDPHIFNLVLLSNGQPSFALTNSTTWKINGSTFALAIENLEELGAPKTYILFEILEDGTLKNKYLIGDPKEILSWPSSTEVREFCTPSPDIVISRLLLQAGQNGVDMPSIFLQLQRSSFPTEAIEKVVFNIAQTSLKTKLVEILKHGVESRIEDWEKYTFINLLGATKTEEAHQYFKNRAEDFNISTNDQLAFIVSLSEFKDPSVISIIERKTPDLRLDSNTFRALSAAIQNLENVKTLPLLTSLYRKAQEGRWDDRWRDSLIFLSQAFEGLAQKDTTRIARSKMIDLVQDSTLNEYARTNLFISFLKLGDDIFPFVERILSDPEYKNFRNLHRLGIQRLAETKNPKAIPILSKIAESNGSYSGEAKLAIQKIESALTSK